MPSPCHGVAPECVFATLGRCPATLSVMDNDEGTENTVIDSHLAFGGLIASVQLNASDWQALLEHGYVTITHHRDSADGDSIIELTIKR
jgi:hypothetical protein